MRFQDALTFALRALGGYPVRTFLMVLAMAIGVASVVVLTGLGEGARRYVTGEFSSLGTHLVIVLPGRSETTGGAPPIFGETPRDLTLDDALAVARHGGVRLVAPVMVGEAPVSRKARSRESLVIGSTSEFLEVRHLHLAQGRNLPAGDPRKATPLCLIGSTVRKELFGADRALGEWLRIGDRRFRVQGIIASEGRAIGIDLDEMVIIPVASAQVLFNSPALFRVIVSARTREVVPTVEEAVRRIIRERHEGEEDVTVITQDAVLSTFDRILTTLTLTVGGIASVSLVVAGILIMNIMLVAVAQRTREIGLLKALGASPARILHVFLLEAALLALAGGLVGLAVGQAGAWLIHRLYPVLSATSPLWATLAALGVALGSGLVFGALPARRAARLDPVESLGQGR